MVLKTHGSDCIVCWVVKKHWHTDRCTSLCTERIMLYCFSRQHLYSLRHHFLDTRPCHHLLHPSSNARCLRINEFVTQDNSIYTCVPLQEYNICHGQLIPHQVLLFL